MFSTLKTLLVAGVALPLAAGFAFAQSAQPANPPAVSPPAATATAPALAPSAGKTAKDMGALKATPAEKKARHEKLSAAAPAAKHHIINKHETANKTGDAAKTSPGATTDAAAKKL